MERGGGKPGRRVIILFAALAVLYLLGTGLLYAVQRQILFVTGTTPATPATVGLDAQVLSLRTADGETLSAWLLRRPGDRLFVYFHGNAGDLPRHAERMRQLAALGGSVLAVDYRGYGLSTGRPSEAGLREDAEAAYAEALALGFRPGAIVLYGESLGSAVAVQLAARRRVAGIILDAPFTSVADVAAGQYWMVPVRLLLRDPFRSDEVIGSVPAPILILHGTEDRTVPFRLGEALAAAAGPRARFVALPGAGHTVLQDPRAAAAARLWLADLPAAIPAVAD